ncbi:MAG: heat shock protein HtpX [Streptosporangiaceae bacterium]|nr:peptidase Ste24p [Streptosporangiaceae bacterium]MDX6431244.1 heat shock protein HtpX [Streptosporangiaceae bacterium]
MQFNGLKTAVLIGALSAVVLAAGWAFGGSAGLTIALVIALGTNGIAFFFSDQIALRSMRAHPVSEVEAPGLYRIVRELATSARQPMPRLYVSETPQPNAFATGRNPRRAAVCCTRGILRMLDERELRAVLGHELSHVYNRDILISSVAAALATVITYLSYLAVFVPIGRSDDDDGPGVLGALLMMVLGPVAAGVIQMAISRTREFQADASGARLTGDPQSLADALIKIEAGVQALPLPPDSQIAATSPLMIANPFRGAGLVRLFSTHPPTAERVARLERMAGNRR